MQVCTQRLWNRHTERQTDRQRNKERQTDRQRNKERQADRENWFLAPSQSCRLYQGKIETDRQKKGIEGLKIYDWLPNCWLICWLRIKCRRSHTYIIDIELCGFVAVSFLFSTSLVPRDGLSFGRKREKVPSLCDAHTPKSHSGWPSGPIKSAG